MASKWEWRNGDLVKQHARVGRIYPAVCDLNRIMVCDPVATSFGDECGVSGCGKVS